MSDRPTLRIALVTGAGSGIGRAVAQGLLQDGLRVAATLSSNDGDVVRQWALKGKGLIMRSEWDIAESLASGHLVRVLEDWSLPAADVVALVAQRLGMSARVKLFLSFLQERFKPAPPWRPRK